MVIRTTDRLASRRMAGGDRRRWAIQAAAPARRARPTTASTRVLRLLSGRPLALPIPATILSSRSLGAAGLPLPQLRQLLALGVGQQVLDPHQQRQVGLLHVP